MSEYLVERVKIARSSLSVSLKEDLIKQGQSIVRPLITLLPGLHSFVVTSDILEILGEIGGNDAKSALITLLEDSPRGNLPKRLISQSCITGLAKIADNDCVAALIISLKFRDNELRYSAINNLGKIALNNNEHHNTISEGLLNAYNNENYQKHGLLIESYLEKLGQSFQKKGKWTNTPNESIIIEPDRSSTPASSIVQEPDPIQKTLKSLEPKRKDITKTDFQTPQNKSTTVQSFSTDNKYACLSEKEQKEILEHLLTSPDEKEKVQIIEDLGKSGNTDVLDELLTVIKSSNNKKVKDAAVDAILNIAPNDLKLRFFILEHILDKRVIGQHEAKYALANALRVAQIGLKRGSANNKPVGSFLFCGPTGVGKTELAKALAEALYGNELLLIRTDMSEYTDLSDKNKLIGSPPGYAGSDEGGRLTQAVLKTPQSVVLFDEIEKAHPEIFNLFLQLLDDGRLTDSKGVTVSFKDTVIIMTSNVGSQDILNGINEELPVDEIKEDIQEILKTNFKPEFLNRLNEVIIFKPLTADELLQVLELKLKPTAKSLNKKYNLILEVSEEAKKQIITKTQQQEFGFSPRELNRIIDEDIVQPLSEKLLDMEIAESYQGETVIPRGGKVIVNVKESKLLVNITKKDEQKEDNK